MKVGILALQGDVPEHARALDAAGATAIEVKTADTLADVDGLIIPGGESTTIGKLLDRFELLEPLRERVANGMPTWGTCAGLILMARDIVGDQDAPLRLGCLDVAVRRNAYGRQVDSFETDLDVAGFESPFPAVFIRAPVVESAGSGVEVLAVHDGTPVLVRQGSLLGSSFHPEMTGDTRVHELFVGMV
ncbi:MAG: pyridoxal 5'-phosphate synthase glutaminase subunit PdxT [Actinomycetota bacterium]|nr:pyridoxal 5'-phosphate synthase glutaminase subunit PdxT [Actinomycetota bacterium]